MWKTRQWNDIGLGSLSTQEGERQLPELQERLLGIGKVSLQLCFITEFRNTTQNSQRGTAPLQLYQRGSNRRQRRS